MIYLFAVLNIAASLMIFVHCACRLTVQRWTVRQPELWIHALLLSASIGVAASNLNGATRNPHEVMLNIGIAAYFAAQTWRLRHSKAQNW
jgi:hypothetical protein